MLFGGIRSPRRATAKTSSTRGGAEEERGVRASRRRPLRSPPRARACSESPPGRGRRPAPRRARPRRRTTIPTCPGRYLTAAERSWPTSSRRSSASATPAHGSSSGPSATSGRFEKRRWVGKTSRPASSVGTTSAMMRTRSPSSSPSSTALSYRWWPSAMRSAHPGGRRRLGVQPPEARAVDLDVRRRLGSRQLERRRRRAAGWARAARASRAADAGAPRGCADGCARAEGRSRRVRGRLHRGDHPLALPCDAVRADELLAREPHGRLVLLLEDSLGEPVAVQLPCSGRRFGQRDVDDVVRAAGVERRSLLVRHGVVRGSDEVGQRAGRAGVADGAKRLHIGHRGERTNGFQP